MKKIFMFLLMLTSFASFSQNDLVIWNGIAAPLPDYVSTPYAISASGVNINSVNAGYQITGNNGNSAIDYNKYVEFKVEAGTNAQILLEHFKFTYIINDGYNGAKKIQVRYSKDNFTNNNVLLGDINTVSGQNSLASLNFPNNYTLIDGEILTIRLYLYNSLGNHIFIIRHYVNNQNHPQGPTLTGSVTYSAPTLLPLVKWTKTNLTPTILTTGVVSNNINGVTAITNGQQNQFFEKIIQSNENALNLNKYIELSIGMDNNHQAQLDKLNLEIRKYENSNANLTYHIRYSKNLSNFNSTAVELLNENVNSTTYILKSIDISNIYLAPNEIVYFRIYVYSTSYSKFNLKINEGSNLGPYITGILGNSTDCLLSTTWFDNNWSNGEPTIQKQAILNSNYSGPSFTTCSLTVNNGKILTINDGITVTVKNALTNNGSIIVENNGSLVQINDTNSNNGNGVFTVKRNTKPIYRYDFTYWSTPVQNYLLKSVSPITLFDKFQSWNHNVNGTQGWLIHPSTSPTIMEIGRGYIIRAPQNYSVDPNVKQEYPATFIGNPNNGMINFNVTGSTSGENKWNLIGNPYPSALDANKFLLENSTKIEGTIYLWTHNTQIVSNNNNGIYSYNPADYASYNLTGSVGTQASSDLSATPVKPTGYIASCQGFFVKGISNGVSSISFKNEMRVAGNNNQFFRPVITEPSENWETTGKHRIWLNISGGNNGFNQTLVGYVENATNGMDWGYDGDTFGGNIVSLYSILDNTNLVIQGRALPFDNQDEVLLGYKSTIGGNLKISIDEVDGLFEGQDIFIEDKLLNVIHNLKNSDYIFSSTIGTFNDRFVLRYTNEIISNVNNANMLLLNKHVQIQTTDSMKLVEVYDILGRKIYSSVTNDFKHETTELAVGVVIVKVTTENGIFSKKFLIR